MAGDGPPRATRGRRRTRWKAFTALAALLAASAAAPATGGAQVLCPTSGTLADLISYGVTGCRIDDKVFSHFVNTVNATFATPFTAASVGYTLLNPDPLSEGFLFSAPWFAPAGEEFVQTLSYQVATVASRPLITDVHLSQFGEFAPGITPTGYVANTEDVCVGGLFSGGVCVGGFLRSLSTFFSNNPALYGPSNHVDSEAWLPAVALLDVQKTITLHGGSAGAGFSLNDQFVTQTATPEPASLTLLGAGLALLGAAVVGRKRASAS